MPSKDTTNQGRPAQQPGGEIPPDDTPGEASLVRRRRPGRPTSAAPIAAVKTRTLILTVARRLFLQRGFADVAVAEVAAAADVTKPTLYYHVGGKEEMYADVLCDLMEEVGGYVRAVTERALSVRQRLEDLAAGYFEHADATMDPLLRDATELLEERHVLRVRETYEREMLLPITRVMLDGMHRGEIAESAPEFLVQAWMGMLNAFTAHGGHTTRTPEQHRQVAARMTAFFFDGAGPR